MAIVAGSPGVLIALVLGKPAFAGGAAPVIILSILMFGVGIWITCQKVLPKPRLTIADAGLTIVPPGLRPAPVEIGWDELQMVALRGTGGMQRIFVHAQPDAPVYALYTRPLDRQPQDIIRLISVRLEMRGQRLEQEISAVLGAALDRWHVKDGTGLD